MTSIRPQQHKPLSLLREHCAFDMLKRGLELPKLIMNEALDEEAAAVVVEGGEERVR